MPVPQVLPSVKGKGHAGGDQIQDFLHQVGKENTVALAWEKAASFATPEKGPPSAGLPARGQPSVALFLPYERAASYSDPWSSAQARLLRLQGHPAGGSLELQVPGLCGLAQNMNQVIAEVKNSAQSQN